MGYPLNLKRGKISDIAPNHPFAHWQISFVPKQTSCSSNSSEKQNSAPEDPMLSAIESIRQESDA